jgi:hypothetical protein
LYEYPSAVAQWSNFLSTTEAGWKTFRDSCVAAGPDGCALYDSSAEKIANRLEKIYASLKTNPLAVPLGKNNTGATSADYGILDYGMARNAIFGFLYSPYSPSASAVALADGLAAIEKGDGYPMWQFLKLVAPADEFDCKCSTVPVEQPATGLEITSSIRCSDGDAFEDSPEKLREHYERMAKDSSFAEFLVIRVWCS